MSNLTRTPKAFKKPGRPRKDKARRARPQFKLVMERDLFSRLQNKAGDGYGSMSAAVNDILFKHLLAGTELPEVPSSRDLEQIQITISPEAFAALERKCQERGLNMTAAIVYLLTEELKES